MEGRGRLAAAAGVGCLVLLLASGGCACGGWWFGSAAFTRFAIVEELGDYVERIEATDRSVEEKAELRVRIEQLRDDVRSGVVVIGFGAFVSHDLVFEEALDDGVLTDGEVESLHEELTKMRR